MLNILDDLIYGPGGEKTMVERDTTLQEKVGSFGENLFVQEKHCRCSLAWTWLARVKAPLPAPKTPVEAVEVVLDATVSKYELIDDVADFCREVEELLRY